MVPPNLLAEVIILSEKLKIVYIGACSHRFSIGLFRNIVAMKEVHPLEVSLVDIDADLLKCVHKILVNMARKYSAEIFVESTTDRRKALKNADFVYISISVGAQEAEWIDIHLPLKFGIPQNTGDTVGPGGIFRAMRCVPVFVEIARDIKDLCPNAVVFNYTNPLSCLTLTMRTIAPDLQVIGLCHELFGGMKVIQEIMRINGYQIERWEEMDLIYGGINHFGWLLECRYKGEDIYPLLHMRWKEYYRTSFYGRAFNFYLLGKHGLFPYPGSRHVAEFIPRYYNYFNYLQSPFGINIIRNVNELDRKHKWAVIHFYTMSRDWYIDRLPAPFKGGEKALDMTRDWKNDIPNKYVVNIPNMGFIPNLPEDCIVEIPGYFKNRRIRGVNVGKMPSEIAELIKPHAENQRLIVEAALKGDKTLLYEALLRDAMCAFIEDEEAIEDMMENMLFYQKRWLPQFEDVLSEEDLRKRRWISKEELMSKERALEVKYPPSEELKNKSWPYVD